MSVERIRLVLRVATGTAWVTAIAAVLIAANTAHHVSLSQMILTAILVMVVTGTWLGIEAFISTAERIIARMPDADEVAARALVRGYGLAQDEATAAAARELPRLSDYRGR